MPVYVCFRPESVRGLPVVHKVCSIPGISHSLLALCRCYFSQLQSAFCSLFVNLKQLRTRSDWDVYVQEYRNWVYLDPERTGIQTTFKKRWEFFVAWEGKYWKTKSVMIALWFSLRSRSIRWWVYQSGLHGSLALGEHPILTTSHSVSLCSQCSLDPVESLFQKWRDAVANHKNNDGAHGKLGHQKSYLIQIDWITMLKMNYKVHGRQF